ncbi:MAG: hypothetical protein H6719_15085 [Sandaracinaceae bacterium]|nr:hypothetical protein [Sandaracinaceae bacterium]
MKRSLALWLCAGCLLSIVSGCVDGRPRRPGGEDTCGDGVRNGSDVCDGADLGGQSCAALGLGEGALACNTSCMLDTAACERSCTPDCSARECGLDPACPTVPCGSCGTGTCSGAGFCSGGDPSAPRILSLTTNVTTLTPGSSLVITAVVTDPDGIADLIGGQLEAPSGGTYGAFVSTGGEGSFSLTLSLADLDAVQAIAAPVGGVDRPLRARFFDSAGLEATRDLTVRLTCDEGGAALCGRYCRDLQTDYDNCGACNDSCSGTGAEQCRAGRCASVLWGEGGGSTNTCSLVCANSSMRCDDAVGLSVDDVEGSSSCVGRPGCVFSDAGETGTACGTPFPVDSYEAICLCVP